MGFLFAGSQSSKNACIFSALFSCSLSMALILTGLLFVRIRSKLFMRVLCWISISSFIANATILSGNPTDYYLCSWQGILQQFFYAASWLWTTVLTYLLFSLVNYGKITIEWWQMHTICWFIPLLLVLLPLTSSTYERSNADDGECWLQSNSNSSDSGQWTHIWRVLSLSIIFICFTLMILWGGLIVWNLYVQRLKPSPLISSALQTLSTYPLILFITWFPNAIQNLKTNIHELNAPQDSILTVVINSLSIWFGGLIALIFFIKSREARYRWSLLAHYFIHSTIPTITQVLRIKQSSEVTPSINSARPFEIVEDFEDDSVYRGFSMSSSATIQRHTIDGRFQSEMLSFHNHGRGSDVVVVDNPLSRSSRISGLSDL